LSAREANPADWNSFEDERIKSRPSWRTEMAKGPSLKSSSFSSGTRSAAERNLALESFKNIANVDIGSSMREKPGDGGSSPALIKIKNLLLSVNRPMPIAEVADRLGLDSDVAADALTEGGQAGVLRFLRAGDTTSVELASPPRS
jgi:hypothetical protein